MKILLYKFCWNFNFIKSFDDNSERGVFRFSGPVNLSRVCTYICGKWVTKLFWDEGFFFWNTFISKVTDCDWKQENRMIKSKHYFLLDFNEYSLIFFYIIGLYGTKATIFFDICSVDMKEDKPIKQIKIIFGYYMNQRTRTD